MCIDAVVEGTAVKAYTEPTVLYALYMVSSLSNNAYMGIRYGDEYLEGTLYQLFEQLQYRLYACCKAEGFEGLDNEETLGET